MKFNIFNLFRSKAQTQQTQINMPLLTIRGVGNATWSTFSFDQIINEGLHKNPYVFACISAIQTAIEGVEPYALIEQNGELVDLPSNHPAFELLQKPCEMYPSLPLWASIMASYRLLAGSAFAIAYSPDPFGTINPRPPRMLHPISPSLIKPKAYTEQGQTKLGLVKGFEFGGAGITKKELALSEVLWWRQFTPLSDFEALSTCQPLQRSIDIANAAQQYNKAILDNGGFVGTVFVSDNPAFGKQQALEMKEMWEANYTGSRKAGKTFFGYGGIKPYKVGLTPEQMGFEELIKLSAKEIAVAFKVPPQLIGDTEGQTYSNYQEARLAFYSECIIPLLTSLYNTLSNFLSYRFGEKIIIAIDLDKLPALSAIREIARGSVREDFRAGLITKTEARAALGYSIEDDGGKYFNETPLQITEGEKTWRINLQSKAKPHTHKRSVPE